MVVYWFRGQNWQWQKLHFDYISNHQILHDTDTNCINIKIIKIHFPCSSVIHFYLSLKFSTNFDVKRNILLLNVEEENSGKNDFSIIDDFVWHLIWFNSGNICKAKWNSWNTTKKVWNKQMNINNFVQIIIYDLSVAFRRHTDDARKNLHVLNYEK